MTHTLCILVLLLCLIGPFLVVACLCAAQGEPKSICDLLVGTEGGLEKANPKLATEASRVCQRGLSPYEMPGTS
jgi:hypothetical protein